VDACRSPIFRRADQVEAAAPVGVTEKAKSRLKSERRSGEGTLCST